MEPEDYSHYDGVWIGPPVPVSVFYAGRRPSPVHSFKKPYQLADKEKQRAEREAKRLDKERKQKYHARKRKLK